MSAQPRSGVRSGTAFTVVTGLLAGLGALAVIVLLAFSGAPSITLLATVLAVIPVVPLVACYLWLDRYEPEPRGLLALGLAWGAFVATTGALILGGFGQLFVGADEVVGAVLIAPVTEEATKGAFLVALLWWRRAELDGVLDGIVYAGMVGIGFAFTENILYLAAAYNGAEGMGPAGVEGITTTFVLRCLVSPFAHPLFTLFIGIGVGIAVTNRSRSVSFAAPVVGYVLAVLTHALWNGAAVMGGFIGVYVLLMVPAFLAAVGFAVWARSREKTLLLAALGDAAQRGLLPPDDVAWLADLRSRRVARRQAASSGPVADRAMRDYQQAAIELGFLHHRLLRGTAPTDWQARGALFVQRISAARSELVPATSTTGHVPARGAR